MDDQTPFEKNLGLALLGLYSIDKYLYNVAARLIIKEGKEIPDMPDVRGYTDGIRIYLTPAWMKADKQTRLTTLTHEVLHVVSKHIIRVKGIPDLDQSRMNVAADLSIMGQQLDLGQKPPIAHAIANAEQYRDKDMFDIYRDLTPEDGENDLGHPEVSGGGGAPSDDDEEEESQGGGGSGDQDGSEDDDEDQEGGGSGTDLEQPTKEEEFEIDQAIQQAAQQAESEGYSTAASRAASRAIDEARAEPIRWDRYLRMIASRMKSDVPTWVRPNRRMASQVYLPSKLTKQEYECTMAMDVSGSVGEGPLNKIGATAQDILTKYVKNLHLLTFDDKIVDEWDLTRKDKIVNLELNGYGGTYVQVVIDHLAKTKRIPKLLIIATDGYIPSTEDPGYPVIWLIVNNPLFKSDYGTVLHIDTQEM